MKKVLFFMIVTLMASLFAILFWHWEMYFGKTDLHSPVLSDAIQQEISVKAINSDLLISQKMTGLVKGKRYSAIYPIHTKKISCTDETGSACEPAEVGNQSFLSNGRVLIFHYRIPFEDRTSDTLVNQWTVSFEEERVSNTTIKLVDQLEQNGTWIAGVPLKGYKQLKLVKYYVFSGGFDRPSLYWSPENLSRVDGENEISFYGELPHSFSVDHFKGFKNVVGDEHLSVIFSSDQRNIQGDGILLLSNRMDKNELQQRVAIGFLSMKMKHSDLEDYWLSDALSSLLTLQKPLNKKSSLIVDELKGKLTPFELQQFLTAISEEEGDLNHERLDALLGTVSDKKTDFFTLNHNQHSDFLPLFFYDKRHIWIKKEKWPEGKLIYHEGKVLFPIQQTLEKLGYESSYDSDSGELRVENKIDVYRFFTKKNTFLMNGQQFGLLEKPFLSINGNMYVDEQWLKAIFHVTIVETDSSVMVDL